MNRLKDQGNAVLSAGHHELRVQGRFIRVARLEGDKYKFLDDPASVIAEVRRARLRLDVFTFMERIAGAGSTRTSPRFAYPMEWDNLAVLPVSTYDDWWTRQIGFKARNKAKQAEKRGVVLREVTFDESFVRGVWAIYNESPIRQGRRFGHYGKSIETVAREAGTFLDSSVFIGAFVQEKLIGFVKLTRDGARGTQAGLMHIISTLEHRDKAPTNALLAHAVRACAARGISYLVYSNFAYQKRERDSLSDFKERNGFVRYDVPRYYVPLTAMGWFALRLGLHRQMVDRIPASVAAWIRDRRNAWNNRRLVEAS